MINFAEINKPKQQVKRNCYVKFIRSSKPSGAIGNSCYVTEKL